MKPTYIKVFAVFLIVLLTGCDSGQTVEQGHVFSTDLSSIRLEGLAIGEPFDEVDVSDYVKRGDLPKEPNCHQYDPVRIYTDEDGNMNKLHGTSGALCSLTDKVEATTVDAVISVLGRNYHEYWYDREQDLKAITYSDAENDLTYTCVFNNVDRKAVWNILSR